MKTQILEIVVKSVESINLLLEHKIPIEKGYDCELYSINGVVDSLSLVTLIASIEEEIENQFSISIILANEKAMSQKRSPFANVHSLVNYIETLLVNREVENV